MDIQQQPKAQNEPNACAPLELVAVPCSPEPLPTSPASWLSVTPNALPAAGISGTEPACDIW